MNTNILALFGSAIIAAVTLFNVPKDQQLEFEYNASTSCIYFTGSDEQLTDLLEEWYSLAHPGWMFDVRMSEQCLHVRRGAIEKGCLVFHVDTLDRQAMVQAAYRRMTER